MSQYFYGVCHDCKVIAEVGNSGFDNALINGSNWVLDRGHDGHNYEIVSEYEKRYEDGAFSSYQKKNDWW